MSPLDYRQSKIQEKRKQTPRRDFIRDIASRFPLNFYKNAGAISVFPPHIANVVSLEEYHQHHGNTIYDKKDTTNGQDFFTSLHEVFQKTSKMPIAHFRANENVSYANCVFGAKNAYLSFVVGESSENVLYSSIVYKHCSNVLDSNAVTTHSSNVYNSKMVTNSYNIFYSKYITNSSNIRFCSNCTNCQYCLECDNQENISYHYRNQPYSKEEYMKIYNDHMQQKEKFISFYQQVNDTAINHNSSNVQGNRIINSSDISEGYNINRLVRGRNVAYIEGVDGCEDFYDVFEAGVNAKYFFAVCNAGSAEHVYCSNLVENSSHIYYSYHIDTCSFCLGCIGLKNKQFCIFNQQYSKEERYTKVDEIFGQMEKEGTLGQFFLPSMNPFYFNDTAAYLMDPSFTKEEITARGYLRRDEPIKVDIPEGMQVVRTNELDQYEGFDQSGNWHISQEILKVIIQDELGNVYRIVKMEYDFLMKHGLPLPRKHRLDRMKENFTIEDKKNEG